MLDLFADECGATSAPDDFRWSVAVFKASGATEVIKRANNIPLRTYYPIRTNKLGDFVPLWRNYLFLEFIPSLTLAICRSTSNFIKILSIPDDDGINHPVLVRKDAINENMRLLQLGKFDDKEYRRRFYGQGSLVKIVHGDFAGRRVQLLGDISPNMSGNKKILVDIGGWRAKIEVFKLGL